MVSTHISSRSGGLKTLDIFNLINVDDLDPAEEQQPAVESSTFAISKKLSQESDLGCSIETHDMPVQAAFSRYAEENTLRFHLVNSSPPATMDPRLTLSRFNSQNLSISSSHIQDECSETFMFTGHSEDTDKLLRLSSDEEYQVRLAKVNASLDALDQSLLYKRKICETKKATSKTAHQTPHVQTDLTVDPDLYFDRSESLRCSLGENENPDDNFSSSVSEYDKNSVESSIAIMSHSDNAFEENETCLNSSFDRSQETSDLTLVNSSYVEDNESHMRRNPIRKARAKDMSIASDPPLVKMRRKRNGIKLKAPRSNNKSDIICDDTPHPKPSLLASKAGSGTRTKRRRQQNLPRSRNGCWTCRARRKKCDETQPYCLACESLGLNCAGYNSKRPCFMEDPLECQKYKAEVSLQIKEFKRLKKSSMPVFPSSEVTA